MPPLMFAPDVHNAQPGDNVRLQKAGRQRDLLQRIADHNVLHRDGMPRAEAVGRYGVESGLTKRKVEEYVEQLLEAKLLRMDSSGFLWAVERERPLLKGTADAEPRPDEAPATL